MYYTKYKINKDFFKNWNDNMAYVLGVIAADGCIQARQFRIGVSDKDVIWLHKIKDIMESTHPIYYRKSDNILLLCVGSKEMVIDIKKYGISEAKSKTLTFPEMEDKYLSHFIRGYFDGDGYIGKMSDGKGNSYIRVSISGTEEFLVSLKTHFNRLFKNKIGSIRYANRCYELTFSGTSVKSFLDWIYTESKHLYLDRKYEKFIALS